jgi:hypothetical protein
MSNEKLDNNRTETAAAAQAATTIFAYGGKNSNIAGYMPFTSSTDGGATFGPATKLPFPALGSNQRPCVHRLMSGNLVFIGDLQVKGSGKQPAGWVGGTGVYAAISEDEGTNWKIRSGARFSIEYFHLKDDIGSHACSLEAIVSACSRWHSSRVAIALPVDIVNAVQTQKAFAYLITSRGRFTFVRDTWLLHCAARSERGDPYSEHNDSSLPAL